MKTEDFYKYVFFENPTCGMEIHFFDDERVKGFFEEKNQTDEFKKKNMWRYCPEFSFQSFVSLSSAINELKEKNTDRNNNAEIKTLEEKQSGLLELLNGEQVKGLRAFKMIPGYFQGK